MQHPQLLLELEEDLFKAHTRSAMPPIWPPAYSTGGGATPAPMADAYAWISWRAGVCRRQPRPLSGERAE
jgi:hypothetical protein